MISIDLPRGLEQHLWDVVRDDYDGDLQAAMAAFLKLHEKFGWKEQLCKAVKSIRSEVHRQGGIQTETIDEAIKKYRKIDRTHG